MKKQAALILISALLCIGCAGTQAKQKNALIEMTNQRNQLVAQGIPAGIGIGESSNQQNALSKAELNARSELSRAIESRARSLQENFSEEVGKESTEHFAQANKTVASNVLKGTFLSSVQVEEVDGVYKVYGIMVMDPKFYQKAMETELAAQQADKDRFRASKAYKQLDEEAAAYENWKASQSAAQ